MDMTERSNVAQKVSIRRIPYPYSAMLAICSDLDETPDQQIYFETIRYLNTTEETAMGKGVGLEVGNTIYFDMAPGQFSYWNTDDAGRRMIQALIRSGHIDCLHSFGDLTVRREQASRALDELIRHDCWLKVWIDHGVAPSNFGSDIMRGLGDVKESDIYHADITTNYGVEYVWRGRVTSVIGQDVPRSLHGLFDVRHSVASGKTVLKESTKGIAAAFGNRKYAMHGMNQVLRRTPLRSGQFVYEFLRSNPHVEGVSCGETGDGISDVLSVAMLNRLVKRQGVSVLYTHLGKFRKRKEPFFSIATRQAMERLAQYAKSEKILVATTRRLLDYSRATHEIAMNTKMEGDYLMIDVTIEGSEGGLQGLSLYVSEPRKTLLTINGRPANNIQYNGPDNSGQRSISLPWTPLTYHALCR